MRTRSFLFATLGIVACSLHHPPPTPAPAIGPARDSLLVLDETRGDSIVALGPVAGALSLLAPDVAYLRAGVATVYGREAARRLLSVAPQATPPGTSWQPLGGAVSRDLHAGYTFGVVARAATTPRGIRPIRFERYIAFWRRAANQPWRIAAYAEVNGADFQELSLPANETTPPEPNLIGRAAEGADEARAADSLFADLADRSGVSFAFSNTVAPTGVMFGPARLAVGPAAVRELVDARKSGASLTWRPVYASATSSFDLAFTIGECVSTERGPSGAAVQRFGKYLTVWHRERDGWKFVIRGGSWTH